MPLAARTAAGTCCLVHGTKKRPQAAENGLRACVVSAPFPGDQQQLVPGQSLLSIQLSSRKEEAAAAAMEDLQKWIRREFCFEEISVIGPVNGSPYKVNDIYRKILYIKSESYDILLKVRKSAQKREEENERYKNVSFQAAVQ